MMGSVSATTPAPGRLKRKRVVLGAIGAVLLALFVAGFVATWIQARDDKSACTGMATPPRASTVRVQHRPDGTRACVWLDQRGRTVEERPLP
jgi:hypothetical protein